MKRFIALIGMAAFAWSAAWAQEAEGEEAVAAQGADAQTAEAAAPAEEEAVAAAPAPAPEPAPAPKPAGQPLKVVLSGRAVVMPFAWRSTDDYTYTGSEAPWDKWGPDLRFGLQGERAEGTMGVNIDIAMNGKNSDGDSKFRINDWQGNVWLKPFAGGGGLFDSLRVTVGIFNVDDIRYKYGGTGSGFHNYLSYIRGDYEDQDYAFARFKSEGFGTQLSWTPVQNLYLGMALGSSGNTRSFQDFKEKGAEYVFKSGQYGIGYTIPGVGVIRAQYVGKQSGDEEFAENVESPTGNSYAKAGGAAQFAFNLKAIKNFDADLGVSVPFAYDTETVTVTEAKDAYDDPNTPVWDEESQTYKPKHYDAVAASKTTTTTTTQKPYVVSLGFDVNTRPVRFYVVGTARIGEYTEKSSTIDGRKESQKTEAGTVVNAFVEPWFYLPNGLILIGSVFFDMRTGSDQPASVSSNYDSWTCKPDEDAKNNYFDIGAGVFVRKNIPGGDVRAGVTLKAPGGEAHKDAGIALFFPVMLNWSL